MIKEKFSGILKGKVFFSQINLEKATLYTQFWNSHNTHQCLGVLVYKQNPISFVYLNIGHTVAEALAQSRVG